MSELILLQFREFWKESKHVSVAEAATRKSVFVLNGGRGSGKSFVIPLRIVSDIMEFAVSGLVFRKVQNTLIKSAYQNIKEAVTLLGVRHLWRFTDSRLVAEYTPRGNKIYFAGADDPEKIKSIKDADFPIALLWGEEMGEFDNEDDVTTIELSILRKSILGEIESAWRPGIFYDYSLYYSYNPPKRKQHWLNKKYESGRLPPNTYVHKSTYLGNPHLTEAFVTEAEHTKEVNERRYRWIYLGEPIGSGVVPFDNLITGQGIITDEMAATFDNIRQGVDFGYGPDPLAFVRWHYDKTRRRLYALDELYGVKISTRSFADWVKRNGYQSLKLTADSAEPRTINELKTEYGLYRIKGAKKGPDSVQHGEEWLGDLEAIIIDYDRTPKLAEEFENIDYKTDKDGDPLPRLEDKNNHGIDATRYALEDDMKGSAMQVLM